MKRLLMQLQAGCWIFGGALSALKRHTHSHMHLYIGTHTIPVVRLVMVVAGLMKLLIPHCESILNRRDSGSSVCARVCFALGQAVFLMPRSS